MWSVLQFLINTSYHQTFLINVRLAKKVKTDLNALKNEEEYVDKMKRNV